MFYCLCFFFVAFYVLVQVMSCNRIMLFDNPCCQKCQKLVFVWCAYFASFQVCFFFSENTIFIVVSEKLETANFDRKGPFLMVRFWPNLMVGFWPNFGFKKKVILGQNLTINLLTVLAPVKNKKPSTPHVWLQTNNI